MLGDSGLLTKGLNAELTKVICALQQ